MWSPWAWVWATTSWYSGAGWSVSHPSTSSSTSRRRWSSSVAPVSRSSARSAAEEQERERRLVVLVLALPQDDGVVAIAMDLPRRIGAMAPRAPTRGSTARPGHPSQTSPSREASLSRPVRPGQTLLRRRVGSRMHQITPSRRKDASKSRRVVICRLGVRRQASGVSRQASGVRRQASGVRRQASGGLAVRRWIFQA